MKRVHRMAIVQFFLYALFDSAERFAGEQRSEGDKREGWTDLETCSLLNMKCCN